MRDENCVNFLLYSYFGIELKDLEPAQEQAVIVKCAQRAYKDFCRTLRFRKLDGSKSKKDIENTHKEFCSNICGKIERLISESLLLSNVDHFDFRHNEACKAICQAVFKSNILEKFCYGQAQKWLNMTIKYIWLLGLRKEQFDRLIPVIHVPVDRYVMKAASEAGISLLRKDGQSKEYHADKSVSWSQWDYGTYIKFQHDLRHRYPAPIIWEGPEWIRIAKEEDLQ